MPAPASSTGSVRTVALVVAAGVGARLGGLPKQYRPLGASSVLRHAVEAFTRRADIAQVWVAVHPDHEDLFAAALCGLPVLPVIGGESRQASVLAGLEAIEAAGGADHVLIHDAARALVPATVIDGVLAGLVTHAGAMPALPAVDSVVQVGADDWSALDRTTIMQVQTPQGFHFKPILRAHREAASGFSDDASLARAAGIAVALTPGDPANFKITTSADMVRAQAMVAEAAPSAAPGGEPRSGTGFDVHRFGAGDHVWLCGVRVPHDQGIIAHSDGDVGLHALTDAVLGAIGDGDIGAHFPPTDPRWRNASSDRFLAHAADLVRARGGRIVHVDVTLICERPKVGPHRAAMVTRIAAILGLDSARVSVKATTTEMLGFTGRREGIAAQAIATVLLP